MQKTALIPYARLPRAHHGRHIVTSTVDVFGGAHWLLAERAPQPGGDVPLVDALVVSVHPDGNVELTELSAVRASGSYLGRLPDGRFLVATSRARGHEDRDQVQIFDALGRQAASFFVGDAIEHLLTDEAGHIWVGHFDENPAGIRRWNATGQLTWTWDGARIPGLVDCYALNVSGTSAWACTYTDFPLVEIRPDQRVTVWTNRIRGARAVAVHRHRVAFYGGYGEERNRLAHGELSETSVQPTDVGLLTLPNGDAPGRRRVAARGSRIYVQAEPFTTWSVFDLNS
ncbi:hypothetical protein [Streptomyces marincola]|uniref:hypothetical protein n=1 Tax=Streptomyces marincola TaxID=2878388 RepID=UPI001CF41177|nr:hypothetical protein [Streptomyces marincola]UCM91635.1 hypothetical protein LC193_28820 [Streptomyces marincola]